MSPIAMPVAVTNVNSVTPDNLDAAPTTEFVGGKSADSHLAQRAKTLPAKVQSSAESDCVNTLHHALGPFLVLSRCFGILPVMGIWPSNNVEQVYFKWKTLPVLVTAISVGFATMDFFLNMKVLLHQGFKLTTTAPVSFSIECLSAFIVFLCLSRNWPNLMKLTRRLEIVFSQPLYTSNDANKFSQRIRFVGWTLILCATVEHSFYVVSGIYSNHLQIKECNLTVNFWHNYYMRERLHIFSIVDYTVWLLPMLQWITVAMTFTWNFIDIFLILVCHGLAARFRQFHWCMRNHIEKNMPNDFWQRRRTDFLILNELLNQYDDKLSALILLSSAQNLYFLAVQIFHSFLNHGNFMNDLYFWFSFIFVAFRSFYMMWTASSIHETANEIRASLYEIPSGHWCLELKRLNEIIAAELFALSGNGFFYLTRRLIFAMAGTLVIYELVLLDQVDSADVTVPLCKQMKV